MAVTTKTGYTNGSDMLLYVGNRAIGSCTSHTTTFNTETKDRAVKPTASTALAKGLWKKKGIVGLSYSISFEGLVFYDETEFSFANLLAAWKAGQSVSVKCMERGSEEPYLEGAVVLTSLERSDPANEDSTYSGTFENDGEPAVLDENAITVNEPAA